MKTLAHHDLHDAPHQGSNSGRPTLLTRLVVWFSHGETPIDGYSCPDKRDAESVVEKRAEPVRWGNFR